MENTFNINDQVSVVLTNRGSDILNSYNKSLNNILILYNSQANNIFRTDWKSGEIFVTELHELMKIFGQDYYDGQTCCFKNNLITFTGK